MIYLHLTMLFILGYLIGNVTFARIFSQMLAKKDITQVGSKNPGTMNMLRSNGFASAMLTLCFDALKGGLPALGFFFLFKNFAPAYANLAFFVYGFGAIVGHCFPVFYKFKGGKGVATAFGVFLFHPSLWWLSLILFAVGFVSFFFIPYAFILTNAFVLAMTIYATCIFTINSISNFIPILVILWLNAALILFLHRGNIKRLLNGTENKVNFKEKVFGKKKKEDKQD